MGKETRAMSKSAPVRIVNGQVLRAGENPEGGNSSNSSSGMDLESGRSLGSGNEGSANNGTSFFSSLSDGVPSVNFDGNNKYKYGAAFLFLLTFGLGAAVPMVMLYIVYHML